ncbi:organic hydroperoxide resistance protein [Allorhizobium borbori]|uniref:Ohr subfamily peroxiredoxin n=1 Tax=Allorhizobium borbori TaxID=485907 RepID=A0A7W6K4E1_9HYPH|nr:organic hydroperoxide resistance protein [Allorhizobium borbori]MBB4104922.1 Ohr subfamily peroxiredoxin [Allorhizobium borbori]PZU25073.1 MAG: organic hydroperoxide resistance protein [Shinella sp.]
MAILYTTSATATGGGRSGRSRTEDGVLDVQLTVPKELGGDGARGTNPEQLFATGYSACFLGALRFVAGQKKVKIPDDTTVSAKVGIGPRDDGTGFGIEVALTVDIPGLDRDLAESLVAAAHIVCPYSHAMRTATEVPVTLA